MQQQCQVAIAITCIYPDEGSLAMAPDCWAKGFTCERQIGANVVDCTIWRVVIEFASQRLIPQ